MLASLPADDRVFLVRMSDPRDTLVIDLGKDRQQLLTDIRQWPKPNGWTPYIAVQTLLETVKREIEPDEKGIILVITDGEFLQDPKDGQFKVNSTNSQSIVPAKPCTPSLPCASDLRQHFLSFKQSSGEGVEAFFVTLASNPARAKTLLKIVESQGVRPQLLEVFNGSSTNGAFEVSEQRDIYPTFTRIASRLLESDVGDSKGAAWSSDRVEFQSPLPVKRLTLIRNGTSKAIPPPIKATSFGKQLQHSEQLEVGMNAPDQVSAEPLQGRVSNLVFKTPLAAHTTHQILFDGRQTRVRHFGAVVRCCTLRANG